MMLHISLNSQEVRVTETLARFPKQDSSNCFDNANNDISRYLDPGRRNRVSEPMLTNQLLPDYMCLPYRELSSEMTVQWGLVTHPQPTEAKKKMLSHLLSEKPTSSAHWSVYPFIPLYSMQILPILEVIIKPGKTLKFL